ncbi:DNA/RNA non-specific endonuclease [Hymenobacter busanensis]|uniref:DNA/RNA non-specific endonuclease n=2 Tax=Hymenobacter busanensis TaxID=2607656 RepID=A0A7L5A2F0_9BACT|nr:DNA/RNA non-specific endonuclease [Hymenobacter busanensis]KAA9333515.1 DNA/RNA non-specific endonuclease [Hymenobacter busanensis]QHJ09691.1 DNA/RNA non-specific endonuclease [Hymenobacter busanensis]
MKHTIARISSFALLTLLAVSCAKQDDIKPQSPTAVAQNNDATRDSNLAMGNPSGAVASTSYPTNYLMTKSQYTLSYHRDRGIPNWVSWHLSSAWLGSTPRQDNFAADATLPTGWYRPTSSSYTGSGFDRGHNCPSADRTGSVADNSATFLMTNMMPQAANNNQRGWAQLEDYCRTLASQGNELYIICGSYGTGGTGVNGYKTTIDAGRVTVPARCWKVVVILPEGSSDASRVTTSTRVIAINTPNDNSIINWGACRTTVDAIEAATGYNILSNVSSTVQATIEARVDNGPTS